MQKSLRRAALIPADVRAFMRVCTFAHVGELQVRVCMLLQACLFRVCTSFPFLEAPTKQNDTALYEGIVIQSLYGMIQPLAVRSMPFELHRLPCGVHAHSQSYRQETKSSKASTYEREVPRSSGIRAMWTDVCAFVLCTINNDHKRQEQPQTTSVRP